MWLLFLSLITQHVHSKSSKLGDQTQNYKPHRHVNEPTTRNKLLQTRIHVKCYTCMFHTVTITLSSTCTLHTQCNHYIKSVSLSVAVVVYWSMHESCIGHCGWILGVGAALEMIFQTSLGHIFLVTSFRGTS